MVKARKLNNNELNRLSGDDYKSAAKQPVVLVLDNVRSLHNVGSAFRTADSFRIEKIFLCGITGTPPNREIEKTALGATETVEWQHFNDTMAALDALRKDDYSIFAVEQAEGSIPLAKFPKAHKKLAFVFGNEVYGVEQNIVEACDGVVEIPQHGTKHSLNVSVSIGIVLWEVCREQRF